eukprot:scaffold137204_cov15-Tisochrysis_lutea.AAC.1
MAYQLCPALFPGLPLALQAMLLVWPLLRRLVNAWHPPPCIGRHLPPLILHLLPPHSQNHQAAALPRPKELTAHIHSPERHLNTKAH